MDSTTESGSIIGADSIITKEIIQSSLVAIAQEMFAAMRKTAMSSVIYEVLDFGVAITDSDGNLASAGAGIPSFVGMLDPAIKSVLRKHAATGFDEGDIFISNDPFGGGVSHTNDVTLVMPVFADGQIVAWTANKGHWMDIGGMAPGGNSTDAVELYQEGLLLPDIRVFKANKLLESVLDIIVANSRLPEQTLGDFWAGISALRMGERRIKQLCHRYSRSVFLDAVRDYLALGERQMQRAIQALPQGRFTTTDSLDDGRELRATIDIKDSTFTVDLTGNPKQDNGPNNATYQASLVSAQAMFKSLVCPDSPANAGTFRPLKLICEEGSLFAAKRPAAVGFYYENKIRVSDLMWKALAPSFSAGGPGAGHFCSICATMIGYRSHDGQSHSFIEPEVGGWGALNYRDGENAQFSSSHGQTFNCPVEVNEARNGVHVESCMLNLEPGGAGRYRGGKGIDLRYRLQHPEGWVTAAYTRTRVQPWSLQGGGTGTTNRLGIIRNNGSIEEYKSANALSLQPGDIVWIRTGTGGGYGNPKQRPKSEILQDLRDEYITPEEAIETYGADPMDVEQVVKRLYASRMRQSG